jgi:hypothetical protein
MLFDVSAATSAGVLQQQLQEHQIQTRLTNRRHCFKNRTVDPFNLLKHLEIIW